MGLILRSLLLYEVAKFPIWNLENNKSKICKFGLVIIRNVVLILCPTFLILNVVRHTKKQYIR